MKLTPKKIKILKEIEKLKSKRFKTNQTEIFRINSREMDVDQLNLLIIKRGERRVLVARIGYHKRKIEHFQEKLKEKEDELKRLKDEIKERRRTTNFGGKIKIP